MKAVFLDRATIDSQVDLTNINHLVSELTIFDATSSDQVVERCQNAQIIITNKVSITTEIIEQLPELKLICVTATGTNNIDLQSAQQKQIAVTNVSGYSTQSVTQYVFAFLLSYVNRVPEYLANNSHKPWHESTHFCQIDFAIAELAGKTLGILGYGELGRGVARIAEAFGMRVLISEHFGAQQIRAGRKDFNTVLAESDIYTIHCPLTQQTEQLFNRERLALLKPGCIFINTARGGLVDSAALLEALQSGHIQHAIIDVLEQEPPPVTHLLSTAQHNNLTLTHHIAWGSQQAQQRLINGVAQNIKAFLNQQSENRVV
ncbi:D-2-hydroxyacid dehydrogenase [Aliikangiella maris]|uniref:D-2-hydroxyacid dehydrogenase n=2 Tax=Aliikangiella maris TaxID=3162458 RepID=A0ABV3MLM3_9GAMM